MNEILSILKPYPFEKLNKLLKDTSPKLKNKIDFSIGEPKHAIPKSIIKNINNHVSLWSYYPKTKQSEELSFAILNWIKKRHKLSIEYKNIISVNGTREGIFSLVQSVFNNNSKQKYVLCPSPLYQIYEGATLLAGGTPYYYEIDKNKDTFIDNLLNSKKAILSKTQIIFINSPNNPTGKTLSLEEWRRLFQISDRYNIKLISDECYSEIYFTNKKPIGILQACKILGKSLKNIVMLTSLSKRSNVPGLRSGFAAGDSELIKSFLLYRTYHGSAMSPFTQKISKLLWEDEIHVNANRLAYKKKFNLSNKILAKFFDHKIIPQASFYLWLPTFIDAEYFCKDLYATTNTLVLPGNYILRQNNKKKSLWTNYIRIALVDNIKNTEIGLKRLKEFYGTIL